MSSDRLPLTAGQKLGRYELLAPVGHSGAGHVWVARLRGPRGFQKLVAIKTLLSSRIEEARTERMLLEEARIASLIQHANVVQTLELGEHEGTLYLVMEWVDGEPLRAVLASAERAGGIPLLVAVNLVGQILRGLQAAHEVTDDSAARAVLHRDLSPDNVLVSHSGMVKLVDFGVIQSDDVRAPAAGGDENDERFAYLAPEQLTSGAVDQRSDLFAVGILLYLLTTGRHPFKQKPNETVLHGIASSDPVMLPSRFKPSYSRTLQAVLLKALDKDRERRWPSAEEMRLALERGIPQAFALGFEAQLRGFMADVMGDRAHAKRETLRRVEFTADTQIVEKIPLSEPSPAPSAGSLRAILLDQSEVANEIVTEARPSNVRQFPRLSRRPGHRSNWPLVAGAVALSAAAFALIASRGETGSERATASPNARMVEYNPARPAPSGRASAPPAVLRLGVPSASDAAIAPSASGASALRASASTAASGTAGAPNAAASAVPSAHAKKRR